MGLRSLFSFPNPVNEVSARIVAGFVVALSVATLITQQRWLLVPLAYGFLARVLTGPTLSPLGQLVTRVITPQLPIAPRLVPGPPKRFAQGMGVVFSTAALILAFAGLTTAASVVLGLLVGAASLESFAGYCLGCRVFAILMRAGVIPASVCEECADVSRRIAQPTAA